MSTRTSWPGAESSSTYLTTTIFDSLPGGWLGYVQDTAGTDGGHTTVSDTSLTVAVTPANGSRRLLVTAMFNVKANPGAIGEYCKVRVTKDGSAVQQFNHFLGGASLNSLSDGVSISYIDTPTSSSHTYTIQLGQAGSSSNTFYMVTSSTIPGYILVQDIGPA